MENEQHTPLWNALIVVSIVLGAVVTLVTIYRHDLLPSLYADNHHEQPHSQKAELAPAITPQDTVEHNAIHDEQELAGSEGDAINNENISVPSGEGKYLLIAGSFTSEENAMRYKAQLETTQIFSSILATKEGSLQHYRVVVSSSDSWKEIEDAKTRLVNEGLQDCWVFQRR